MSHRNVVAHAELVIYRLPRHCLKFLDKKVGLDIEAGTFKPDRNIRHTHEGSIGNLCNDRINALMHSIVEEFGFCRVEKAEQDLLASATRQ